MTRRRQWLEMMSLEDADSAGMLPITDGGLSVVEEREKSRLIRTVLGTLEPREVAVIRCRFGLWDGDAKTLHETSKLFRVTPSRIWQLEAKALRKLRRPERSDLLRSYIEDRWRLPKERHAREGLA